MYVIVLNSSTFFGTLYYAGGGKTTRKLEKALTFDDFSLADDQLDLPFFRSFPNAKVQQL